eukprot:Nitzschia sp. Nitz4//scaffold177_size45885//5509//9573//NITZ4_007202-RA/size45885-processed-gene-0.46-mRNA-1//-1//CDS//3329539046//1247//frame0
MLESVKLDGKITSDKVNEIAGAIREKLGLDLGGECYKDMAEKMMRLQIAESGGKPPLSPTHPDTFKEPALDAPTWSQETASPEQSSHSSQSRSQEEVPKSFTSTSTTSSSTSTSTSKYNHVNTTRGRSPARRSPARAVQSSPVPKQRQSRSPVGGATSASMGKPPAPELQPARSRSPLPRNRSKSPFARTKAWSPVANTRSSRNMGTAQSPVPAASPSVFYDAHMHEESVMIGSPSPHRMPPRPKESSTPSGERPPLASVTLESNSKEQHEAKAGTTMPPPAPVNMSTKLPQNLHESMRNLKVDEVQFNLGVSSKSANGCTPYRTVPSPSNRPRSTRKKTPMSVQTSNLEGSVNDDIFSPMEDSPISQRVSTPSATTEMRGRSSSRKEAASAGSQPTRQRSRSPFHIFTRWGKFQSPRDAPTVNVNPVNDFTSPVANAHPSQSSKEFQPESSAANGGYSVPVEEVPKTPYEPMHQSSEEPPSANPEVLKKGRNTKTPLVVDPSCQFAVGSGTATKKGKGKVKGRTKKNIGFRRGLANMNPESYMAVPGVESMESPTATMECKTTKTPMSGGAPMEIDGNSPVPPAANQTKAPEPVFNLGTAGPTPAEKGRTKRHEKSSVRRNGRHTPKASAPSASMQGPSVSQAPVNPPGSYANEPSTHARSCDGNQSQRASTDNTKLPMVLSLREEGKLHYISKNYKASILTYTNAIKQCQEICHTGNTNDLMAVLLSNRAAGLLMVGACKAAALDCQTALSFASPPGTTSEPKEGGLVLRPKLSNRMARAFIKLGELQAASSAFSDAISSAQITLASLGRINLNEDINTTRKGLEQVIQEATLGQNEVAGLQEVMRSLAECNTNIQSPMAQTRKKFQELLGHINTALLTATKCELLHTKKVEVLASLKRWREIGCFCERLAAENVAVDGCFTEDLVNRHPFPGVPPARYLSTDFFGEAREDTIQGAELKLNSKAMADAILRLPVSLLPTYLRSLRLEERYAAAEVACRALDQHMRSRSSVYDQGRLPSALAWLPQEQAMLIKIRVERERGDELFRQGRFGDASTQYAACLNIDADGTNDFGAGKNAGGRFHAVIHCNRAACLMAEKKFAEAITECTAALRIHPRYMKALLRRARCYSRLDRLDEAANEFKQWLEYANEAKKNPHSTLQVSACIFDGPHETKPTEVPSVQGELNDVLKAKARADAAAETQRRYREQKQRWQSERFNPSQSSAESRRDYFYSQQGSSARRWDSFADRGPKRNTGNNGNGAKKSNTSSNSQSGPAAPVNVTNEKDHYKALGVANNANEAEIKKAYRKQALKYHPDKNSGSDAADMFRRVKEAYEVLSDSQARKKYDMESRWRRRF